MIKTPKSCLYEYIIRKTKMNGNYVNTASVVIYPRTLFHLFSKTTRKRWKESECSFSTENTWKVIESKLHSIPESIFFKWTYFLFSCWLFSCNRSYSRSCSESRNHYYQYQHSQIGKSSVSRLRDISRSRYRFRNR